MAAALYAVSKFAGLCHYAVSSHILSGRKRACAVSRFSLRGTIRDPQGEAVPGATVTLVDTDTDHTQVSTSDANGIYDFNALPPAPYRMTVEHAGFSKKLLDRVQIIPEQLNSLDVQLDLGQVETTVTVSGTTSALDTETATVSGTISSNQIEHKPSFNRDVFQLAPGVFGDASQNGSGGSYTLPGAQGISGSSNQSAGIFQIENAPQIQSAGSQETGQQHHHRRNQHPECGLGRRVSDHAE
jgi:hypothetical protein